MLLKNFSVYLLFAGLPVPTIRYLASFLAPANNTSLNLLMNALPRKPGSYLLVDDRIQSKTRFACQSIRSGTPEGEIFMIF